MASSAEKEVDNMQRSTDGHDATLPEDREAGIEGVEMARVERVYRYA